jgi:hypothetical protein
MIWTARRSTRLLSAGCLPAIDRGDAARQPVVPACPVTTSAPAEHRPPSEGGRCAAQPDGGSHTLRFVQTFLRGAPSLSNPVLLKRSRDAVFPTIPSFPRTLGRTDYGREDGSPNKRSNNLYVQKGKTPLPPQGGAARTQAGLKTASWQDRTGEAFSCRCPTRASWNRADDLLFRWCVRQRNRYTPFPLAEKALLRPGHGLFQCEIDQYRHQFMVSRPSRHFAWLS